MRLPECFDKQYPSNVFYIVYLIALNLCFQFIFHKLCTTNHFQFWCYPTYLWQTQVVWLFRFVLALETCNDSSRKLNRHSKNYMVMITIRINYVKNGYFTLIIYQIAWDHAKYLTVTYLKRMKLSGL